MDRLRIALTGVGGFGHAHISAAETLAAEGIVKLAAFTEPNEQVPAVDALKAKGARHYTDYDTMLAEETNLDLVCIATPIPYHVPMTLAAFERGLHVFLEKPPAVTIQDLRAMVASQERHDRYCAVGYHDVSRPGIIALKHRLCEGVIGSVTAIRAEARWCRGADYYRRNNWAGKTRLDGAFVLDGPMNNACGHVLNLAAYLAADEPYEFARPLQVQAELYRANDIEGEDTDCLRATMDNGVEVCVHLTQCASKNHPRCWDILGEDGAARFHDEDGVDLPGEHIDCREEERGTTTLLRRLVEVVLGSDEPLLMPLAEAEGHILMSNAAYESSRSIHDIPGEHTHQDVREGVPFTLISGIEDAMLAAAAEGKLLSECGVPWAVPTSPYELTDYREFPQQWQG